jgi:hypothetical protein
MGSSTTPDQYVAPPMWTPEQLAALPHDNAGPKLLASVWSLFGFATLFLSLRIYCRLLKRQSLWWDDGILIAAWVRSTSLRLVLMLSTAPGADTTTP